MIALICPRCSVIPVSELGLKFHMSERHGGFTKANLSAAGKISVPDIYQRLDGLIESYRTRICSFARIYVALGPRA